MTDDCVIVETTYVSASPHSKQINLGLLWGGDLITVGRTLRVYFGDPIFLQTDIVLVYFWVPDGVIGNWGVLSLVACRTMNIER